MKILYIMRFWPVYGGGETITVTLANEFVKRGHEVHVAYSYERKCNPMPYVIDKRIKEVKLFTIEHYKKNDIHNLHNYIVENSIEIMINQWGNTKLCSEAIKNTQCKLITCWHLDVFQKVEKPKSLKEKILYTFLRHNLYVRYNKEKQLKNHDANYQYSDKYVFLSESFLKEYVNNSSLQIEKNKVSAIANPLTYNYSYDMKDYAQKKKQVLFVGRIFEYHKRLSYILKIWKALENDVDLKEWVLKIVGDGPDMQNTQLLAKKMNLCRVSFEGFKKPNEYYEESSLFMMTSAFEGFGMTLVEAQQYGVVCVAMDSYKSLHDILSNEKNGIIVENDDIEGFVEKMKTLMLDEEKREKYAIAGLESCKKFSVSTVATQWEMLFSKL